MLSKNLTKFVKTEKGYFFGLSVLMIYSILNVYYFYYCYDISH